MNPTEDPPAAAEPPPRWRRRLLLALGPVLAVLAGAWVYFGTGRYVSVDNAYLKSEMIAVSSDVDGRVVAVLARENGRVEAGQALFEIDPRPFEIALQKALAAVQVEQADAASGKTKAQGKARAKPKARAS